MDTKFLHPKIISHANWPIHYFPNKRHGLYPQFSSHSTFCLSNSLLLSIHARRNSTRPTRISCQNAHRDRSPGSHFAAKRETISTSHDGAVNGRSASGSSLDSNGIAMRSNSIATTTISTKFPPSTADQCMVSTALSPNGRSQADEITQNAEDHHICEITSPVRSTNIKILDRDVTPAEPQGIIDLCSPLVLKTVSNGLGIVQFLKHKNFLITGATGFLAKVLIEKILRTQPGVGKLFLLIKAKDSESALQRLKNEVIYSELFKCLQEIYGNKYEEFMLKRLVPVAGDITRDNLGIQADTADDLLKDVDIIVNSAANTAFDERYDVALDINTRGAWRLMEFGKHCQGLKLFLQISTAYVNGQRQGRVMEKPFHMGDSIAKEKLEVAEAIQSPLLDLDVRAEFELANKALRDLEDKSSNLVNPKSGKAQVDAEKQVCQGMKDLGMKRARTYGWQDTYVFTKVMGEMLIGNGRGDLPVVIIRPSVIESTYADPFPGWMEGNRMMDPVVLYYGKGQLTGFLADPNGVLDVVPADMVVNATLAAMAKHAGNSGLEVYHVASSVVNPLVFGELAGVLFEHFQSNPYVDTKGKPIRVKKIKLFGTMEDFSSHIWNTAFNRPFNMGAGLSSCAKKMSERHKSICIKSIEQVKYLANIYKPYTFYQGRFDNSNTEGLLQELSQDEQKTFGFDVRSIEWKDYISNTHIPGLRQHVMKGRGTKMV